MAFRLASCFGFPERIPELQLNDFYFFSARVDQNTAGAVTEGGLSLAGKACRSVSSVATKCSLLRTHGPTLSSQVQTGGSQTPVGRSDTWWGPLCVLCRLRPEAHISVRSCTGSHPMYVLQCHFPALSIPLITAPMAPATVSLPKHSPAS